MIILVSIFFILTLVISGKKGLKIYSSNLVYFIVLFAFVISILGLLDLLDIFSYYDFTHIYEVVGNSTDDSIVMDSNFALLPGFFGMIGVIYYLGKTKSQLQYICHNFLLVIFSLNIILSGSRRGLILLIVIFLILTIAKFIVLFKNIKFLNKLGSNCVFFLLSLISITIILYLFFFHTSINFKTKTLDYLGSKNVVNAKVKISKNLFRYVSTIDRKSSFSELLWTTCFDPKDPDSGWGSRTHKTIFPLTGINVEIVPKEVKGYLMDSTCNASYSPGDDISESYTFVVNLSVTKGDRYKASVYCFVSDSFDVETASFGVGAACINNNIVSGKVNTLYNLERKGVWQKLEVDFDCNHGVVPIYMSFRKRGVKDFSKLKGYVIFAYPQYEKIYKKDKNLPVIITQSKSDYTVSGIIDLAKKAADQKFSDPLYKFEEIYDTNESCIKVYDTVISHSIIPSKTFNSDKRKYFSSGIFCFPLSILNAIDLSQNDHDPIRNWVSKFISEDTTYYPYEANIVLDTISNEFEGSRIMRWQFAWQIFNKEYRWPEKLIGGGFNFLNWYGYYFIKDKTASDWPHNPFLSILLYSGILGLIIYCFFLYKVFYYYLKYINEYPLLFIFFIITFFFSFFSGGSPFDPPLMGFFSMLPFFINYIEKKSSIDKGNAI